MSFQPTDKTELQSAVNNWVLPDDDPNKDTSTYNDINISDWDTSLINDMSILFQNITNFNDDIGNWDTSNVTNMAYMFFGCTIFNQYIGNWNTSNVKNMGALFTNSAFNQNINTKVVNEDTENEYNAWDVSNVTLMASILGSTPFNQSISNWDTSNVKSLYLAFNRIDNFNDDLNTKEVTVGKKTYNAWNVSNVTNMIAIFYFCTLFNSDLDKWDTSNTELMSLMFAHSSFNKNISGWNTTQVINIAGMFRDAPFNQDISEWKIDNVINMDDLFLYSQFNNDISKWNTSNVTSMYRTFMGSIFNQNISDWDTSNVTSMNRTFNISIFNQDISDWDTLNVENMDSTFRGNTVFNQNISGWDISNVTSMISMLDNTNISVVDYDAILNSWASQSVKSSVFLGAQGLEYSSASEVGRNSLITSYGWTITGDTFVCFIKDTMILILENGIEVEKVVQELKNGDMVKISTGEYKKLVFIGTKTIDITKNINKIRIMKQGVLGNNLPNKDLLVTSGHSVLFKNLENINKYYNENVYDNNVDGYYKMMSQHCKLFDYVKEDELEDIRDGNNVSYYHFCLENDDEDGQYGVYSNGVLSETMALSFSKKNF